MKRLLLCALSLALLSSAARAGDDRDHIYGGEPPGPGQALNRRLTLPEFALFDVVVITYANDARAGKADQKGGYFPDRKAAYDAVWGDWDQAQQATKPVLTPDMTPQQIRAARAAFRPDQAKIALLAGSARERLKPVAQWYLQQTDGGKGDPKKITDFENDLLVSYFKHANNQGFHAFVPWLTGTVVPTSPEDIYKLAARVSDSRASLRALMKLVADNKSQGLVDVGAEYSKVDAWTQDLVNGDGTKLAPVYQAAGMTRPTPPAGKPFYEQFTGQENAVLSNLRLGGNTEFDEDQRKADSDRAALPSLVSKWRTRVLAAAQHVVAQSGSYKDAEARHNFEDVYLRQRLDQLDKSYWKLKQDLEQQAFRAARPSGPPDFGDDDEAAQSRLAGKFRVAAFNDIKDYVQNRQRATGAGLAAWARKYLREGADFHELAGPNPHPKKKPGEQGPGTGGETQPENLDALLDSALKGSYQPIEIAIIKKVADDDEKRKLAHGGSTKDWHQAALDAARHDTDKPGQSPLRDYLKGAGFDDAAFAKYVGCDAVVGGGAAGGGDTPQAMDQLKTMFRNSLSASGSSNLEAMKSRADVITAITAAYPGLVKYCQDESSAEKERERQKPGGGSGSLSVVPPPSPVDPGARSDPAPKPVDVKKSDDGGDKKKGGKDWSDKMVDATIGGAIGWVAGTIVAAAMGLGPIGFLLLVVGGAAIGAGMALKSNEKKKK